MRHFALILVLAAAGVLSSCGPTASGVQIINANIALSAAETAGAKRAAIYEYTAAKEYLQKAREEHSYSDFWASRIYADKALEYALAARKKAEGNEGGEQPVLLPEEQPVIPEGGVPVLPDDAGSGSQQTDETTGQPKGSNP